MIRSLPIHLPGRGRAGICDAGWRKNARDYVELLIEQSTRTHLINRQRARCARFAAAARREDGEYPSWIFDRRATPLQRQSGATRRADFWRASGGVAPQSQGALAILLRRALPGLSRLPNPPEISAPIPYL